MRNFFARLIGLCYWTFRPPALPLFLDSHKNPKEDDDRRIRIRPKMKPRGESRLRRRRKKARARPEKRVSTAIRKMQQQLLHAHIAVAAEKTATGDRAGEPVGQRQKADFSLVPLSRTIVTLRFGSFAASLAAIAVARDLAPYCGYIRLRLALGEVVVQDLNVTVCHGSYGRCVSAKTNQPVNSKSGGCPPRVLFFFHPLAGSRSRLGEPPGCREKAGPNDIRGLVSLRRRT